MSTEQFRPTKKEKKRNGLSRLFRGRDPITEVEQLAEEIDFKKIEGFFNHDEGELIYHLAKNCPSKGTIVEIGSWKGRSTSWMGRACKKHSGAHIYAIDPHVGSPEHQAKGPVATFAQFQKNIKAMDVEEYITPVVKFSYDALDDVPREIDLLFIDGAHEYDAVRKDFELWSPRLKVGGVIAFHDSVGEGWPGVHQLVAEELFLSSAFRDVRFIGSITYATKVLENSFANRVKNRSVFAIKRLRDVRKKIPQPFRNLEHHLVKKCLQRSWIGKIEKANSF